LQGSPLKEIKPHRVSHYLERRDAEFAQKNGGGPVCLLKHGCSQVEESQVEEVGQAGDDRLYDE